MKIVYIITDLSIGGAQMMLYKLLSRMSQERFTPVVISLMEDGTVGDRIQALGIPIYPIGMKSGKPTPASIWRFIRTVRQLKPDLLQGWMYHGNLAAQLAKGFVSRPVSVLWNVRNSLYSFNYEKAGTEAVIQLCAKLSDWPNQIIYNSKISANQHEKVGYRAHKSVVIPNGFDTEIFASSSEAVSSVRRELGIPISTLLIGLIGRYHPVKDHATFLQAAALLLKNYPDLSVQFILSGSEVDGDNESLCTLVKELEIVEQIHLLGERQDIPRLTAALDIASSSSYTEAFSNVIGEAMSCGVPCVVTDVGDSAWIVGNTGRVVPPRNPEALAIAWKELIDLGAEGRAVLGKAARARVIEHFSLDSVVGQYEALYESVSSQKLKPSS
jgi:glycosyltransferase involved in cell wall biosynthesis